VYESPTLFSFTFAAIVGGAADNGTLEYMNTDMAGVWRGPMKKGNFLVCEYTGVVGRSKPATYMQAALQ
jgi:hypothetical protein